MKTSNHSHPHFETSTTSRHWQPHPVHFTKLNRFQSFFSPARRLNLYYILYCFFPWTIKDQSAVLCLMYNTIQFHEQSWASQARGKKFHPLVQFSHLPPHPHSPIIKIQIQIRKIQRQIRKIQRQKRKIQRQSRKIPKIPLLSSYPLQSLFSLLIIILIRFSQLTFPFPNF